MDFEVAPRTQNSITARYFSDLGAAQARPQEGTFVHTGVWFVGQVPCLAGVVWEPREGASLGMPCAQESK